MRYALLAALILTGLGTQLAGLESWETAKEPAWLGGTVMMLGGAVTAAFMRPPGEPPK